MIEKEIEFDGNKYFQNGIFQSDTTTYVEYRNDKLQKIIFFELENETLCEVKNKEDLKKIIINKYDISDGIIE